MPNLIELQKVLKDRMQDDRISTSMIGEIMRALVRAQCLRKADGAPVRTMRTRIMRIPPPEELESCCLQYYVQFLAEKRGFHDEDIPALAELLLGASGSSNVGKIREAIRQLQKSGRIIEEDA